MVNSKSACDRVFDAFVLSPYVDSAQDKLDVLPRHLVEFVPSLGPGEAVPLKSLEPQAKSVPVPPDHLDGTPRLPTEDVIASVERTFGPNVLDDGAQPIDLLPHIREAQPDEYALVFGKNHDASMGSMVRDSLSWLNLG